MRNSGLDIRGCDSVAKNQTFSIYCSDSSTSCINALNDIEPHKILSLPSNCGGGYFARIAAVFNIDAKTKNISIDYNFKADKPKDFPDFNMIV